jgi:hypothetical protein
MKKQEIKWSVSFAQVLIGFVFIYLGHPYVGVLIAAIHF